MKATDTIIDVDASTWDREVIQQSYEVPVVVDFWAAWCGPCRTLGPILENAVSAREGDVVLAKLDVDANQQLAGQYRVQGIPAVKAFKDGQVVAEFTGAQPAPAVEQFLDGIVPTEADERVAHARTIVDQDPDAAARELEAALELHPQHQGAALLLAELVLHEDPQRTLDLVKPHRPQPAAEALATRAELALAGGDTDDLATRVEQDPEDAQARLQLARLRAAEDDYDAAVELLLEAVRIGGEIREPAREQLVAIFGVLGDDHPLVQQTRPQLARALF